MKPSLRFLAFWLVVLGVVDFAYLVGWLDGGTITSAVYALSLIHPVAWHIGYVLIAIVGYLHFFGSPFKRRSCPPNRD